MDSFADAPTPVTIAVVGADEPVRNCARVLRGAAGVTTRELTPSEDDLLAAISDPEIDAIAFTCATAELPSSIRRALMSGRHVLVTAPVALASKQLEALDDLARRRERVLVFDAGYYADERIAFVRRMASGANALWRPRYVRALRTGASDDASIDAMAVAEIEAVLAITGGSPSRVSAFAPRIDDESGAQDAIDMTLIYDGGAIARIDVSMVEPEPRQEIVIACDGRTIVLDAYDMRAPLRIAASGRHRFERTSAGGRQGGGWAETVSEHPLAAPTPRESLAAAAFATAVRARDVTASNARAFAQAALVFETARASISRGGEPVALPASEPVQRPELRVIHGGGHRTEAAAPELRLVPQQRVASGGGGSTPPDAA